MELDKRKGTNEGNIICHQTGRSVMEAQTKEPLVEL